MSEFERAKRKYERKVIEPAPKKKFGMDAIIKISISTEEGRQEADFRIVNFLGNTLSSHRSGKGLEERLINGLKHGFGGVVRSE